MKLEAKFVASAFALSQCPKWKLSEVAVAGRSNVGKSSLINALTGAKGLARISKMPGRTRSINFFALDDSGFALVDLPGFGYARIARSEAAQIAAFLRDYLKGRANLIALLLLVDARRGPQQEEAALAAAAIESGRRLIVAGTKSDKLKRSERAGALQHLKALSSDAALCSALDGENLDALRRAILQSVRQAGQSAPPLAANPARSG